MTMTHHSSRCRISNLPLRSLLPLLLLLFQFTLPTQALVGSALFSKIQKDFAALTRRVTARHILVSNQEVALALKRKIREQTIEKEEFVVDIFEQAAKKYSKDETTNFRGGLLGELVPQGYCQSEALEEACFQVPLGLLEGPVQTDFGYHLLLVTERTNCPKLDGSNTKLVQTNPNDIFGTLEASEQVGKVTPQFILNQALFWILVFFAGGIAAELAEKVGTMIFPDK
ncbi:unnamed protein product [Cylindrotheca closterium]|uniref:Peptidyl-prolyl cis-trans isomerase n=1 Tax=Cylindrotheca closterium TaxID=2856 RepID=A0AAD2JGM5_9STRA|nr:unnamed protein product [Cylindrotheca closterium]CAJ1951788.1 unnamed protein product [Cylindrotheca closterium]